MNNEWICTDEDTQQYGRKIDKLMWEYKQPDINDGDPVIIDLEDYTADQIENCISSYGYSIKPMATNNVYDIYQEDAYQIICECLFEMEI